MSFLNALLLGGMLASLAPLIIHLLNRSRFQSVEWGAMHLLDAALETNTRRFEWEHWLLLLLRCLIPAIFAFALARPVLSDGHLGSESDNASVLILLDDSLSMSVVERPQASTFESTSTSEMNNTPNINAEPRIAANSDDSDNTKEGANTGDNARMQEARSLIRELTEQLPRGEWSLWTIGGRPRDRLQGASLNANRLLKPLSDLKPMAASESWIEGIRLAIESLAGMSQPAKHLVLVSDFQESTFGELDRERLTQVLKTDTEQTPVHITLLQVGAGRSSVENLSLQMDVNQEQEVLLEQPFAVKVRVVNHGQVAAEGVQVEFLVDSKRLASRTVNVAPGAEEEMIFGCQLIEPGDHHLKALIVQGLATDQLSLDNSASRVIHVEFPHEIAIVDSTNGRTLGQGSSYLALALAPFQNQLERNEASANRYRLNWLQEDELARRSLTDFDAIVLVDVPRLSVEAVEQLVPFVQSGGGLVVVPGTRIDIDWYNNEMHGQSGLLPAIYEGASQNIETKQAPGMLPPDAASPLTALRSQFSFESLEVELLRWHTLQIDSRPQDDAPAESVNNPADRTPPNVEMLLRMTDGAPWLVGKVVGDGYVVQSGIGFTEEWSNLPLRPVFVPIAQAAMSRAIERWRPQFNFNPGDSVPIHRRRAVSGVNSTEMESASDRGYEILTPDGETIEIELADLLAFDDTNSAGFYQVRRKAQFNEKVNNYPSEPTVEPAAFVVAADPRESELTLVAPSELNELANELGANSVSSIEELVDAMEAWNHGRELWRWFVVGLLVFLFVELLLAQRLMRGSV